MKIGIWNIDHPEVGTRSKPKNNRLAGILDYLNDASCDFYILSEANSAVSLDGYQSLFSDESPYINKSRSYNSPNVYHQVAIYSRLQMTEKSISEPINGVLCELQGSTVLESIYGNVITIKDQWKKDSSLKYSDRVSQQLEIIDNLPNEKMLVAGDFNLKLGWTRTAKGYKAIENIVELKGWHWPTREQTDSVQHILHTPDIKVVVSSDRSVKEKLKLSDHPFITLTIS